MCAQVCGWARTVNSKADLHSGAVTFSVKVSFLWILPLHSLYSNNGKKSMFASQQIQGFTIIWKKCWVFELVRPDTWLNSFSSVSPLHKLPNLSKSKSCLIIHTKRNQSGRILDLGYLGCFCYGGGSNIPLVLPKMAFYRTTLKGTQKPCPCPVHLSHKFFHLNQGTSVGRKAINQVHLHSEGKWIGHGFEQHHCTTSLPVFLSLHLCIQLASNT